MPIFILIFTNHNACVNFGCICNEYSEFLHISPTPEQGILFLMKFSPGGNVPPSFPRGISFSPGLLIFPPVSPGWKKIPSVSPEWKKFPRVSPGKIKIPRGKLKGKINFPRGNIYYVNFPRGNFPPDSGTGPKGHFCI